VNQVAPTARVTSASATCNQFAAGTAGDVGDALYTVRAGKIAAVTPGAFVYYTRVVAPAASFQVKVSQTNPNPYGQVWRSLIVPKASNPGLPALCRGGADTPAAARAPRC